ncbi:MAG: quinone-interacting membrane-bound oxidoreductase complex subunit QmoC [bacterium]
MVESGEKQAEAMPAHAQAEKSRCVCPTTPDEVWAPGRSLQIEPDLEFIRALNRQCGDTYKKCMQCGTCSATCTVSPDREPFPRKEMIWAAWGMKERLLADPDVWLCHQCNDCSERCPRGASPGDVLSAIRQECVIHYSAPRFLGRWVNQSRYIPLLLGLPALLLAGASSQREAIGAALGFTTPIEGEIVYSYSGYLPHWLLNTIFFFFAGLVLIAAITGVVRYWRGLKAGFVAAETEAPTRSVAASFRSTLKDIILHRNFAHCIESRGRFISHICVFFGFLALTAVTTWVITIRINPLVRGDFIYPLHFWNPWKLLANLGGLAVLAGCFLMIRERVAEYLQGGVGKYFDWAFLSLLILVVITGFATELLHYFRMEPHRHVMYFIHLVGAFALLVYLPYSKFAHVLYRTTAMVFAEHVGRKLYDPAVAGASNLERDHE